MTKYILLLNEKVVVPNLVNFIFLLELKGLGVFYRLKRCLDFY